MLRFDAVPETLRAHVARRPARRRPRSTSRTRCAPASRSAATSCRATSTASASSSSARPEGDGAVAALPAPAERRCATSIEKGSITVAGVSLTVADAARRRLRGRADPAHAAGDHARRPRGGRSGESRGRRDRAATSSGWRFRGAPLVASTQCRPHELPTMSPRNRMSDEPSPFCRIEEAIEEIRAGRMVVVVDAPDRENEGDLCMAAEHVTPEADQLHGHARPRADLPDADARALRRARPAADGRSTTRRRTRRRSRSRSRPARASRPASRPPTARTRSRSRVDPDDGPARHHPARPRLPAARAPGRRARAHRPDRGLGRPRPARRPARRPA